MNLGNEIEIEKIKTQKGWKRTIDLGRSTLPKIPYREIDFIPISRIVPAIESKSVRNAFSNSPGNQNEHLLNIEMLDRLSNIMDRRYDRAGIRIVNGLGLSICNAGSIYSGFDMGSGESSVITMLLRFQNMPMGGLIVIEEIELGLHAEAQARLVENLIHLCMKKKVQIICTSHSEVILDRLPRQARILLRKQGLEHDAIKNVSTRFAIHEMSGLINPELVIYTEDNFAKELIEEALAGESLRRIKVVEVGSNQTLARQLVGHFRGQYAGQVLGAFDGDCEDSQIEGWIRSENLDPSYSLTNNWIRLPGDGLSPESWVVNELQKEDYKNIFSKELNCSLSRAQSLVESLHTDQDSHNICFTLSNHTGFSKEKARQILVRSIGRTHPALNLLRERVNDLLR